MNLFCFGAGYIGMKWLEALPNTAKKAGTTTHPEKIQLLKDHNIEPYLFQGDFSLKAVTHMLVTIPPENEGDLVLKKFQEQILEASSLEWVGLLSTTGVYGDHGGDLVDETAPCHPTSDKTKARLNAENQWLNLWKTHKLPVHIFRLAGIYGPDRTQIPQVLEGKTKRINKPGHKFSRIHADDIIQVLKASMERPNPGSIYNLADDHPAATREVIEYICEELGHPLPPLVDFETADLSPMLKTFYKDNKRVSNEKIMREFGLRLLYPSYKEGLREILEQHKV